MIRSYGLIKHEREMKKLRKLIRYYANVLPPKDPHTNAPIPYTTIDTIIREELPTMVKYLHEEGARLLEDVVTKHIKEKFNGIVSQTQSLNESDMYGVKVLVSGLKLSFIIDETHVI